jgi:alanine racemase
MDHSMVDVSAVPEVRIGDEVVLIGKQGNAAITANRLAAWAGTTVHEVPTVIGHRVKRVYLDRERPEGRSESPTETEAPVQQQSAGPRA